jgi:tRNA threonylcarbamoyl adenosine modification protein YeaZ
MRDANEVDPLVLGLDTSTMVHVGLARGAEVLATATVPDRMAHVEQLTPLVRRVVETAGVALTEVDLIVVGLGPGPFTGLRVGVVTARVLAAALGPMLRGICSLDVIAAEYAATAGSGEFLVATDARRREVYWARYGADGTRSGGPEVSAPALLPRLPVVGPAADLYAGQVLAVDGPRALDPGTLAVRGPSLPDAGVDPLYLRRPDATEPGRPKSVSTFRVGAR